MELDKLRGGGGRKGMVSSKGKGTKKKQGTFTSEKYIALVILKYHFHAK